MTPVRVLLLLGAVAGSACFAPTAAACAACGCGDPTLVSAGAEQPFQGRLRASLQVRARSERVGQPHVDEVRIREARQVFGLAWAPSARTFLILGVPLLYRQVDDVTLATYRVWGLGDAEARFKWFFYRDRRLAPRLLLAASAGARFPTGSWQRTTGGELLPLEAQPGTGSLDALGGLSAAVFGDPWSGYVSAEVALPTLSRAAMRPGPSLLATGRVQWQPFLSGALRGIVETRTDGRTREGNGSDPDSGGTIVFAGAEAAYSPLTDLTLAAGVRAPVLSLLRGWHSEGLVVAASAVLDL